MNIVCASLLAISFAGSAVAAPDDNAAIRQYLGLSGFGRQTVKVEPDSSIRGRVFVHIDLGQGATRLVLDEYSVRAPGFEMVVHDDAGPGKVQPPPISTYRGFDPATGAVVAASIIDGRVSAAVRPDDGEPIFVQPVADAIPGASAADSVVYTASDVIDGGWRCAADMACEDCGASVSNRGPGGACLRAVEVLFDTDYPFFQLHSSAATTVTDIENVVNQCDIIYRRDAGISWTIRQINVRTTADDPYADLPLVSVDPGTILGRLGSVWSGTPTPARDVLHLMTGRDLAGSTIGIAYVGVVCRSPNTGVSQSLFTSNLSMRTILTAHEVGHNFGSNHDASGNFIMAPSVSPSNQLVFSPGSIAAIASYVGGNGSCLTTGAPTAAADAASATAPQFVLVDVLANDAAACGNALTLSLPSSTSVSGGAVSISNGTGPGGRNQVRYTPPAGVPSGGINDSFTYRITEASSGGIAIGSVSVAVSGIPQSCPSDFNASGAVSVQDIFDFLAAYFAGDPRANINGTGGITVQDLFQFLAIYFTPCP